MGTLVAACGVSSFAAPGVAAGRPLLPPAAGRPLAPPASLAPTSVPLPGVVAARSARGLAAGEMPA
eukprot:4416607-Lingulodinium_polyedra.AAC.1